MNKKFQSILTIVAAYGIIELISLIKINVLLGAKTAIFSGFSLGGPLVGLYSGMGLGAGLFLVRRILHCAYMGSSLFSPFSLYLPTLGGGFYFKSTSYWIRVVVPSICMVLFVMHPVGVQAWYYAAYWLTPLILYGLQSRSLFATALGATFVQHAIGSVLWLYLMPTTAAVWTALLPIVVIERLVCALGMVAIVHSVSFLNSLKIMNTQPQKIHV